MMNWTDVNLIVKTIVENKIHLEGLEISDAYGIEKATDLIFGYVREVELKTQKDVRS